MHATRLPVMMSMSNSYKLHILFGGFLHSTFTSSVMFGLKTFLLFMVFSYTLLNFLILWKSLLVKEE